MQTNPDPEANDSRTASDKAVFCKELLGIRPADHWGRYKLSEIEIGDLARWRATGQEGVLFMDGPYLCLRMVDNSKPAVVTIFPEAGDDPFVPSLADVRRMPNAKVSDRPS